MNTGRPATIYISAASDLMAEREALARMIAALPVTLAWRILQTPITDLDPLDLETLQAADLHLLLMGSDIRAPVGLEWHVARRADRPSVAFLKRNVTRTPAGQVFIKDVGDVWQPFTNAADVANQVRRVLAEHLLQNAIRYALTPTEVARLEALPASDALPEESAYAEDAGHSAVILSRERFVPSEGVMVDESYERREKEKRKEIVNEIHQ